MSVLEFIFNTMLMIVIAFVVIGVVGTKWNLDELRKENKKLKEDLHEARKRKMKKESK